jgi:hypothetical protein
MLAPGSRTAVILQKEQNRMPIENMGIIIHMVLNMSVPLTNILLRNTGTTCTGATRLFEDVELCAPAGAVPDFERMTKEYVRA